MGLPSGSTNRARGVPGNRDQATAGEPWKGKTQGSIRRSFGKINPRPQGTLGRVKAQKPRPVGPARSFGKGNTDRRNGTWVRPDGNVQAPPERRKLRRVNPMSAARTKQGGQGFEGAIRREGDQTPWAGPSGQALARNNRTFDSVSAEGSQSPREEPATKVDRLGFAGRSPRRRRNSTGGRAGEF